MSRKFLTYASLLIIFVFIGYMIFDSVRPEEQAIVEKTVTDSPGDRWEVSREIRVLEGSLRAIASSPEGLVFAGGDSFVKCYESDLGTVLWTTRAGSPVTSLAYSGGLVYASTLDQILVIDKDGKIISEWGPYTNNSIITSVAANTDRVAFADAGNKMIYVLDKSGEVQTISGQGVQEFIIPSAYFDVAMNKDNSFYAANTGHRRIELRNEGGMTESWFGEPGLAPEAFCGCCNPAHFAAFNDGFVTAEKGVNRIKLLDTNGGFVEFVSSKNDFTPSIPLDVAISEDGKIIYAADPSDSKIYVFKRNE